MFRCDILVFLECFETSHSQTRIFYGKYLEMIDGRQTDNESKRFIIGLSDVDSLDLLCLKQLVFLGVC
jgi:hypothetical protein